MDNVAASLNPRHAKSCESHKLIFTQIIFLYTYIESITLYNMQRRPQWEEARAGVRPPPPLEIIFWG